MHIALLHAYNDPRTLQNFDGTNKSQYALSTAPAVDLAVGWIARVAYSVVLVAAVVMASPEIAVDSDARLVLVQKLVCLLVRILR